MIDTCNVRLRRHHSVDPDRWQLIFPKLKTATALALEGLGYGCIDLTSDKYVIVQHTPSLRHPDAADTPTAKTIHMYAWPKELSGRAHVGDWAVNLHHELLHTEWGAATTLGELAATEGLSNVGAYEFVTLGALQGTRYAPRSQGNVEKVTKMPRSQIGRLYDRLGDDFNEHTGESDRAEQWLRHHPRYGMRLIDAIGTALVLGQVRAGNEIGEMLRTNAAEVLGYESGKAAA